QQHAIVRHGEAIILGLRHAGGELVGHRAQLERRRQLGADIGVEGGGGLTLERLEDRAALIVGERLEGIGNGDERVVGRVLRGKFRRHHIGRRRVGNRQGAVDQYCVRRRGGAPRLPARLFLVHLAGWRLLGLLLLRLLPRVGRWRLLLSGGKAGAGGKCQRERAGAQESILHGSLLLVRSARALSGRPVPHLRRPVRRHNRRSRRLVSCRGRQGFAHHPLVPARGTPRQQKRAYARP